MGRQGSQQAGAGADVGQGQRAASVAEQEAEVAALRAQLAAAEDDLQAKDAAWVEAQGR